MARQKSLLEAYILGIPFGIFGAHHFYLRRYRYGIIHLCTLGLFGIGYLVDLFRMKWLVDHTNKHGTARKELSDVYLLGAVGGIFGAHHFYLEDKKMGILYLCTAGVFGIGWIVDLFRMRWLVRAHNNNDNDKSLATAYILAASPLGLFGGHHYYLHNYGLGVAYTCTFGVFGIGWIVDLIRMKLVVKDSNFSDNTAGKSLITAYIFGASPLGLFGGHHYYLGNYGVGMAYSCTLGIFCIGWVIDLFRMRWLVQDSGGSKDNPKRSIGTAYILGLSPLGIFGASHYYLGNYVIGVLYTCTAGVFGVGWLLDFFQMWTLVDIANKKSDWKTLTTTYILATPPLGIFGGHHYYLGRIKFGIFYSLTFGLLGLGWLFDLYRMPTLFKRYKEDDKHKYTDDAYMYWLPFGLFGLHQFYLQRKKWGIFYACSLGCLGIGWFIDAFRLPSLVEEYNEEHSVIGRLIPLQFKCYCSPKHCRKCCGRSRRKTLCPCNCAHLCATMSPCCMGSSKGDAESGTNDEGVDMEGVDTYQKQNESNYRQYDDEKDSDIPYEVRMMNEADKQQAVSNMDSGYVDGAADVVNGDAGYHGVQSYYQGEAANLDQVNVEVNQSADETYPPYPVEPEAGDLGNYDYNDYYKTEHPPLPEPPGEQYDVDNAVADVQDGYQYGYQYGGEQTTYNQEGGEYTQKTQAEPNDNWDQV